MCLSRKILPFVQFFCHREHPHRTSDIFWAFLTYLPTYHYHILYNVSLPSKIRYSLTFLLTYLPKNLTSYVNAPILKSAKDAKKKCPNIWTLLFCNTWCFGTEVNTQLKSCNENLCNVQHNAISLSRKKDERELRMSDENYKICTLTCTYTP